MSRVGQRFTLDGSDALEHNLGSVCAAARNYFAHLGRFWRPRAVLLGGGYGRGEGGVLRTHLGDHPYNDLEFYVFQTETAAWASRALGKQLSDLGHRLEHEAGIDVEFKITSLRELRRSAPSMFWYDLVSAHRWVLGAEPMLCGCEHHLDAGRIPLHEATRLLMNRCSGLLFAAERLARLPFRPDDADFVGRNLAKAELAFGDCWLAAHGQYHWSCLERRRRLAAFDFTHQPDWADSLRDAHAAGVEFKLHPARSTESREVLLARHAELTELGEKLWLWLEGRRLRTRFASTFEYVHRQIDRCPESSPFKNRLLNLHTFGRRGLNGRAGGRYPRERLLRSLPLMLFGRNGGLHKEALGVVQEALETDATSFQELVESYRRLWARFN